MHGGDKGVVLAKRIERGGYYRASPCSPSPWWMVRRWPASFHQTYVDCCRRHMRTKGMRAGATACSLRRNAAREIASLALRLSRYFGCRRVGVATQKVQHVARLHAWSRFCAMADNVAICSESQDFCLWWKSSLARMATIYSPLVGHPDH